MKFLFYGAVVHAAQICIEAAKDAFT